MQILIQLWSVTNFLEIANTLLCCNVPPYYLKREKDPSENEFLLEQLSPWLTKILDQIPFLLVKSIFQSKTKNSDKIQCGHNSSLQKYKTQVLLFFFFLNTSLRRTENKTFSGLVRFKWKSVFNQSGYSSKVWPIRIGSSV